MAYSDFTLKKIQELFTLKIVENTGLYSKIEPLEISNYLTETLLENVSLAISINTEKARSELIIAPILVEIRKIFKREISIFSGTDLNVDKEKNLTGFCDFIISKSPEQLFLSAPVITIVEAKNENIMSSLGQCIAEMIAARIFNEKEGNQIDKIYGVITSGNIWKFLKLDDNSVYIDLDDYGIKEIPKIMGILASMIEEKA